MYRWSFSTTRCILLFGISWLLARVALGVWLWWEPLSNPSLCLKLDFNAFQMHRVFKPHGFQEAQLYGEGGGGGGRRRWFVMMGVVIQSLGAAGTGTTRRLRWTFFTPLKNSLI